MPFSNPFQISSLLALLILTQLTNAIFFQSLTRDGAATDIKGYKGTSYQAIRYEPLCGSLGTAAQYSVAIDVGDRCTAAMNTFGNSTSAGTFAVYDGTGVRLSGTAARIGNGQETCLCMAMQQTGGSIKGAICLWVDGQGRGDYEYMRLPVSDYIFAGGYRVVDRAMPQCKDVNLQDLKDSWSATAAQAAATDAPAATGTGTAGKTTGTATAAGAAKTTTAAASASDKKDDGGLSTGDKIGLGVGIPSAIVAVGTIYRWCKKGRIG